MSINTVSLSASHSMWYLVFYFEPPGSTCPAELRRKTSESFWTVSTSGQRAQWTKKCQSKFVPSDKTTFLYLSPFILGWGKLHNSQIPAADLFIASPHLHQSKSFNFSLLGTQYVCKFLFHVQKDEL